MTYSYLLESADTLLLESGSALLLEWAIAPPQTWINVYDDSGNFKARIFEYRIDECSTRSNTFGILKFRIHQDATGRDQLIKRYWIEVYRNGNTVWSGVICHMRKSFDEAGDPTRFYEVLARSFEWLPYWRVIVPVSGNDYLVKAGAKVDDAVKFMVREQMETGEVDDADRALTGFSVEADDTEHADTKTLAARYEDNLGELLAKWAAAYDLDWWVEADCPNATFVLRTRVPRRGTDKSASVVFTVGRHNLVALEYYEDDLDTGSLVYVGGPGSGATQVVHIRPAAEPTGWDRREKWVAMAQAEYSDELKAAGDAWLDSFGDVLEGVRFTLTAEEAKRWPDDFDQGDVVTVFDPEFSVDKAAEIKEINLAVDEDGQETITVLVGEPVPSQWQLLQAGMGKFSSFDNDSNPGTPANPSSSTATVTDDRGNQTGSLQLNWDDNSELDLSGYQVEVLRTGETKWKTQRVTESEAVFEGFPLGSSVTARVKARDSAGNESAYLSFGGAITMPSDTTAPGNPANFAVTAVKQGVKMEVDRPTEQDWAFSTFAFRTGGAGAYAVVHEGKTSTFVLKSDNYVSHECTVRHTDEAGNDSDWAGVLSATPEKIEGAGGDGDIGPGTVDTADITNLAVETAKIGNLAVTTAKIDNLAVSDAKINDLAAGKITAGTISATVSLSSAGTIGFVDGAQFVGSGGAIACNGQLEAIGDLVTGDQIKCLNGLMVNGTTVIDGSRILKFVTMDVSTITVDGNWDIGNYELRARTLEADVATGTPPLTIASTTLVTNLNADRLDGYHAAEAETASTVVARDADSEIRVAGIRASGDIIPTSDNAVQSGEAGGRWSHMYATVVHEGDHVFLERTCAVCEQPLEMGQKVDYLVIAVGDEGTRAIPAHTDCMGEVID